MQASNQSCIFQAEKRLEAHGLDPRVATLVFQDLFDLYHVQFTLALSETMPVERSRIFDAAIERVIQGEPYQYVVGFAHFYDEIFTVNHNVLIPRFETEELVAYVLEKEPESGLTIVDIGTGSGAIGLSIANHSAHTVYMTDKYESALTVARENVAMLSDDKRNNCFFLHGDMFEPLIERDIKVDVLVSNPPYIADDERDVMSESTRFEPSTALFAEDDGLYFYKHMIDHLSDVLNPGGRVYFEIGYQQGRALKDYIRACYPNTDVHIIKDINKNDRIIHFKWEGA